MIFEIRLYDTVLAEFEFENKFLEGQTCRLISSNEEKRGLLPIGMDVSGEGISEWLKTRVIPKNREFVHRILSLAGLSSDDTFGIVSLCKGLSLNDSYWVVERGFEGSFADYNLYDNPFSKTLALIAYTGYGSGTVRHLKSSPEFTTNGMLRKCWRRENGKIYLYKGGTSGAANTGREPYSEFYASQIAECMGLGHVEYHLKKWKGTICSTCELFTSKDIAYVPVYKFLERVSIPEIARFLKSLGGEFFDEFSDMMIFDALICNVDRHSGNFGLLVDSHKNVPIAFAPIFDNGLSLFNFAMDEDIENLSGYANTLTSAFSVPFYDIVRAFMTDRQRQKLCRINNFRFKRHPRYNLPEQRLEKIEQYLKFRVAEMLK